MYAHDAWTAGAAGYLGTYTNHPIAFMIAANQKMVLDVNGNLGIGTTGPGAKLVVNQASNSHEVAHFVQGVPTSYNVDVWLKGGTTADWLLSKRTVDGSGDFWLYNPTLGYSVLTLKQTGNVGIGTTAPSAKLSVASAALGGVYIGNGTFENSAGWNQVFDLHGASHARITARTGAVSMGMYAHDAWNLGTAGYLGTYTNHPLAFIINTTPRMVIDVGGNVGIGTTTPAARLHLWNTSADNELRMTADGSFDPIFRMTGEGGSTGEGFTIQYDNSVGDTYIKNIYNTTNAFHFQTASQEAMTIKTNGDIGIGTTNPVGKLHIAGAHANGVIADGNDRPSAAVTGVYPQMVMMAGGSGNTNHGATLMLGSYDAGTSGAQKHWSIGSSGVNSTFLDIGYSAADINPHSGIRNYNGSTFMTILNSGNVGIGTTTPAAKLEVNGDFIRTIARAQGYNQADGTDNGAIATRTLTFVKKYGDTGIRVTYSDGRRVLAASTGGRWEVKFNAASCPTPGPIAWDIHSGSSGDYHRADATVGTCFGLPAGTYTIQIYVGPTPGYPVCDLYTGWIGLWSLEAEEVR